jgi:hypothetical protein
LTVYNCHGHGHGVIVLVMKKDTILGIHKLVLLIYHWNKLISRMNPCHPPTSPPPLLLHFKIRAWLLCVFGLLNLLFSCWWF